MSIGKNSSIETRAIVLASVLGALLVFYVALNTARTFEFEEVSVFVTYDKYARALLHGQMSLMEKVHPDRAKAAAPCDPTLGIPFITDAVLWKGKYYFLQEPFPVLFHVLWIALTDLALPTGFMVIAYAWGALICLWIIIGLIRRKYYEDADNWIQWYVWLLFAFSATQLYMVSRPVVYHEAIVAGMFFTLVGVCFYTYGIVADYRLRWFVAAGAAMGCGLMCRNILVFYPMLFFVTLVVIAFRSADYRTGITSKLIFFTIPVFLSVAALLLHNYVRFGEPFNFGRTSICFPIPQLYTYVILQDHSFRLAHIWPNLINYFWSSPTLSSRFPYVYHGHWTYTLPGGVVIAREMVSSFLYTMPGIVLVLPTPFLLRSLRKSAVFQTLLAGFGIVSLCIFFLLLCYYRAVGRYLYEFTPLLFIVMYCNTVCIWEWAKNSASRRAIVIFALCALFVGQVLGGIFLGFNGLVQR